MMKIRDARELRNLSQKELAARMNIPQNTLSQYETGARQPDNDTLVAIANELSVSADFLLGIASDAVSTAYAKGRGVANLPTNIRFLRKSHNMTQLELSRRFNVASGTIAMWETGHRSPDLATAKRLADFFDVSLDFLVSNTFEPAYQESGFTDAQDSLITLSAREQIKKNLLRYMQLADYSQVKLAEALGISKGTVNNWTKGNNSPDVEMVPRICALLNISVSQLYGDPEGVSSLITDAEYTLVLAYRKASADDRAIIDNIVARYTHAAEVKHA